MDNAKPIWKKSIDVVLSIYLSTTEKLLRSRLYFRAWTSTLMVLLNLWNMPGKKIEKDIRLNNWDKMIE